MVVAVEMRIFLARLLPGYGKIVENHHSRLIFTPNVTFVTPNVDYSL